MAAGNESWHAPDRGPCAYVARVQAGVLAEARGLFPYDPYNQTRAVLDFYRAAERAAPSRSLWVRLGPPGWHGRCV